MLEIRRASEADFGAMWLVFQAVVAPGDTYVFAPTASRRDVYAYWFDREITSYVAEDSGRLVGMYKLLPNQPGLGSHVANASFMVSPTAHGKGIGRAMGQHCLIEARRAGYLAMQFNFVVSTNEAAVKLWKKLGFFVVFTLPRSFNHRELGYVDAHVMYRFLDDIKT